jgi:hypothetical protein
MIKTLLSKKDVLVQHAYWHLTCNKINSHGPIDKSVTIEFARNEAGSLRLTHAGKLEQLCRSGYIIPIEVWAAAEKLIAAK